MWADWIEGVLKRAGFRVLPRSTVTSAGAGGDVRAAQAERAPGRSPGRGDPFAAYLHSPQAQAVWKSLSASDAPGTTGS